MVNVGEVIKANVEQSIGRDPVANSDSDLILRNVQQSITEGNHPLKVVAGVEMPTAANGKAVIEASVGSTFDTAGNKVLDEREAKLKIRGDSVIDHLTDIINGRNLDSLADDADVKGWVESIILQIPEQAAQYNALGEADQKLMRISLLTNSKTIETASNLLKTRLGPDRIITDKTEQLRKEANDLQQETKKLDDRRQEIEKELIELNEEIKEYTIYKNGANIQEGKFVTELKTLEQDASPVRSEVDLLSKQVGELDSRISTLESALATSVGHIQIDPNASEPTARRTQLKEEIIRLKEEQDKKINVLSDKRKILAEKETRIKAINDRKTEINNSVEKLTKEQAEVTKQLVEINPKLAKALGDLHQEKLKRITLEGNLITSLERILPEAMAAAYNEKMDSLVKADIAVETNKANDAKTKLESDIRTNIANAYRNANHQINWDQVRDQVWPLFLQRGVDGLLEGGGGSPPSSLLPAGTTLAQLKTNKELYDAISTSIKDKMGRLRVVMPRGGLGVVDFLRGPKPLSRQECIDIIDQMGEPYLKDLVTKNQSIREALESVGEQGMISGTARVSENLKKRSLGSLLLLLPLLLAGGFLFGKGRQ